MTNLRDYLKLPVKTNIGLVGREEHYLNGRFVVSLGLYFSQRNPINTRNKSIGTEDFKKLTVSLGVVPRTND